MNRRAFVAASTGLPAVLRSARLLGAKGHSQSVAVHVDTGRRLGKVPSDFMGLGYEISSVANGLLSAGHRSYVQLVQRLSPNGVIRIGGNTSDYSSFAIDGQAVSTPKGTVVNESNLQALGTFLEATGWKLIWGLNLGGGNEQNAVSEAQAVAAAAKEQLLAFEIGNEPDLFGHGTAHRDKNYGYDDYLREYTKYKAAVRHALPHAPFAGPDAASATDWVTRFAADEGKDLKLLTHHYYRECASPTSTLDRLLHPDPKLMPELEKIKAASVSSGVPFRICETNSLCGGGKPGVSDTFGAALWALDFLLTLAWADAAGVNMETGLNQLGRISWYSPIGDDEHGRYSAKPEYYGLLAFTHAIAGEKMLADYDPKGVNLTVSTSGGDERICVTVVNKDAIQNAEVKIACNREFRQGRILRLSGPSLESTVGVTLGGSEVNADGRWNPTAIERVRKTAGQWSFEVPAGSAALLTLDAT